MNLITREELHRKLERGDDFKLVMTLSRFAFEAKHIPSSINFATPDEAVSGVHRRDDIVVYCGDVHCPASIYPLDGGPKPATRKTSTTAAGVDRR
jgi:hypothetical protein